MPQKRSVKRGDRGNALNRKRAETYSVDPFPTPVPTPAKHACAFVFSARLRSLFHNPGFSTTVEKLWILKKLAVVSQ